MNWRMKPLFFTTVLAVQVSTVFETTRGVSYDKWTGDYAILGVYAASLNVCLLYNLKAIKIMQGFRTSLFLEECNPLVSKRNVLAESANELLASPV